MNQIISKNPLIHQTILNENTVRIWFSPRGCLGEYALGEFATLVEGVTNRAILLKDQEAYCGKVTIIKNATIASEIRLEQVVADTVKLLRASYPDSEDYGKPFDELIDTNFYVTHLIQRAPESEGDCK